MITMSILKKWAIDTAKNSTEFSTLCTDTIGSVLNFYRNSPADQVVEVLPFLTGFSDESSKDYTSQQDFNKTWSVPFALGIEGEYSSIDDDGVTAWESTDKAELLAESFVDLIRTQARNCGINGVDIHVVSSRIIVSQIGEADDIQANIFILFGEMNHI